jgi:hypothetical protein
LVAIADGTTTTSGGTPIPEGALVDPATGQPLSLTDPRNFNGVVQCGATGQPSGCVKGHLFNPGPRIGFAYDPWGNGKTAIRGGYGIFFEHGNGNEANVESLEATPPLVLLPSQPNIVGYTNIGAGGGQIFAFPLGFNTIDTRAGWPYVQQWNLNVQHEFPQHFIASIAYVGSKGTHLGRALDSNQIVPLPLADDPYPAGTPITPQQTDTQGNVTYAGDCSTMTVGPGGSAITGPAATYLGIACGNDPNPNRRFIGYGSLPFIQYLANSSYNSMQIAVNRSFAPLTVSVAYTYSHSIDNSSDRYDQNIIDSFNIARARGSSNFDERHMLHLSYIYALPSLKDAARPVRLLLGDWQTGSIISIQTGTPFSVTDSNFSDNAGTANGVAAFTYADLVGNPKSAAGSCAVSAAGPQLYNPCAFADPRGLTFGDAPRNVLRNPRTTNFDMSLAKNFKFNESRGFQFRAEAFNIFNHTEWSGVSNDFTNTDFLHPNGAHRARTLQLGLKFLF